MLIYKAVCVQISGCLEQYDWFSVEGYCGSLSYIEYDFISYDDIEVWAMKKEVFSAFESGIPLTNINTFLLFSGVGAHGRFIIRERGIWTLVFYNRINYLVCFLEGQNTVEFITVSDKDDPVDNPSSVGGSNEDSVPTYNIGVLKLPIVLLIFFIFLIPSVFIVLLLYKNSNFSRIKEKKINIAVSKILIEKGGSVIQSKKFYGIEWIIPRTKNKITLEYELLELPESYSKKIFEKAYFFRRNNQYVIRLKIFQYLNKF